MTDKTAIKDDTHSDKERPRDAMMDDLRDDILVREYWRLRNEMSDYRQGLIKTLPAFIVNNSANMIGAIHMTAELAMFKSNGTARLVDQAHQIDFKKLFSSNPDWGQLKNAHHYIIDPPKNVWASVSSRAQVGAKLSDFGKPQFYVDSVRRLFNVEEATKLDIAQANKLPVGERLVNRWQARSTFAGLIGWGINLITPNAKESPQEIERRIKLSKENPAGYVADCFGRAVWFPIDTVFKVGKKAVSLAQGKHEDMDIGEGKRQFTGLAVFISGICSFLGGFRNVSKLGGEHYYFNWQYCATGAITFISSLPLLFQTDNEKGYSEFGGLHLMRVGFLPGSIMKKYAKGDKGAEWYTLGHVGLQSENAFAAFVGGAQKLADGTVVDHKAQRKEIHEKLRNERSEGRSKDEAPSTSLQEVAEHTPPDKSLARAT